MGAPEIVLRPGVQTVDDAAYEAIVQLGTKGGWDALAPQKGPKASQTKDAAKEEPSESKQQPPSNKAKKRKSEAKEDERPEVPTERRKSRRSKG